MVSRDRADRFEFLPSRMTVNSGKEGINSSGNWRAQSKCILKMKNQKIGIPIFGDL